MTVEPETVPEDDYISLANFCEDTMDAVDAAAERLREIADEMSAHVRDFRNRMAAPCEPSRVEEQQ